MDPIYARIARWGFVRLREPEWPPTIHIVGYIVQHERLVDTVGEPYLGSALQEIDLARRLCRNGHDRVIALVGDPLPPGKLPEDIGEVLRKADTEWGLRDPEWTRIELDALATLAERGWAESSQAGECRDSTNKSFGGDDLLAKPTARLVQWRIIRATCGTEHLAGVVSGHRRLRDGARILSSPVLAIADTRRLAETENTLYSLGTPGVGDLPEDWRSLVNRVLQSWYGAEIAS